MGNAREWWLTDPQREIVAWYVSQKAWPRDLILEHLAKQALDQTGHAAIGLPFGLAAGGLSLVRNGFGFDHWLAVGAVAATLALAIREAVQLAKTGQPHLLDRALDVAFGPVGAVAGYALVRAIGG